MGKYIYGIIKSSARVYPSPSFGPIGISGAEVYLVGAGDIACIVSDSPPFDYRNKAKEVIAFHLSVYQSVIEKVMSAKGGSASGGKDYTVLPVKFGTIVEDKNEVRSLLLKGYQEIIESLDKMDNKTEFDVVALWSDFDSVLKEIGEEKEIKVLKAEINAVGTRHAVSLQDGIKIGKLVKVKLDKRRDKILELIQSRSAGLNRIAVDTCNHECLDDKMIMNTAFLIERDKETQFDKLINEIDEKLNKNVNFRCVGPLPPYSFSQVEVKKIGKEALKKGLSILGLEKESSAGVYPPHLSLSAIKDAYRTLARRYHPDMNPKELKGSEQFNELTQAYELLLDYSKGVENGKVSKNSIVIKL